MASKRNNRKEDRFLKKAAKGEREGLEYLLNSYRNLAYTVAIRIVGNNEDAEEVVQDSFLKVFQSIGRFRKSSRFSTWLYQIVYNTALTKVGTKRVPKVSLDSMVEPRLKLPDLEWDTMLLDDKKKFIDLAMNRLPTDMRLVLTLHYLAEKSVSEIMEIMNLERSAIKMRLLRGRKKLKSELELLLGDETNQLL